MRRNEQYIADWQELQKILEERYEDYWIGDVDMPKEVMEFCLKWNISEPIHPDMSYDDFTDGFIEEHGGERKREISKKDPFWLPVEESGFIASVYPLDVHRIMFNRLRVPLDLFAPIAVLDGYTPEHERDGIRLVPSDNLEKQGRMKIEINLNYSKTRLANEFKTIIDQWKTIYENLQKRMSFDNFCKERGLYSFPLDKDTMAEYETSYKEELKKRGSKFKQKHHFENFDLYLAVFDLKKQGKSYNQIVKELGLHSKDTAINHYKAASRLIEKGIDQGIVIK